MVPRTKSHTSTAILFYDIAKSSESAIADIVHWNCFFSAANQCNIILQAPGQGATEVAIKTVKKEFIDQDPKVKENLDREIAIMKVLSTCQYAVKLHNVMVSVCVCGCVCVCVV